MVDRRSSQAAAEKALDQLRPQVEAGSSRATFRAVYLCGRAQLIMPDWLVAAFERGLARVEHHEAASWDAAFGAPELPRGRHRDSNRPQARAGCNPGVP